jgi:hypothetical protein
MKKYLLGIFAVALAVGFSAFTLPSRPNPDSAFTDIWFEVDPDAGTALDPDAGMTSPPGACLNSGSKFCARSLTYPGEVTYDGAYHIASGVDITTDYDNELFKN